MRVSINTNIHTYKYTHYIHTYIHTNIQTYIHTNIQTYKHTNIHTYKHTYIHTYIIRNTEGHALRLQEAKIDGDALITSISIHTELQRKVLNLAHDWLFAFLPHCISKINRVSYGLLSKEDIEAGERKNMPKARSMVAVPFIGTYMKHHIHT